MRRRLKIPVNHGADDGPPRLIGPRKVSAFEENLAERDLELEYARMAEDGKRDEQAMEWAEATFRDIGHETGEVW